MAPRGRSYGITRPASRYRPPNRRWPSATRHRRQSDSAVELLAGALLLGSAALEAWIAFAFAAVVALVLWLALLRPTACDVENKNGKGSCENTARGALRACHLPAHKRAKHDALWAYMGLRNPAQRWRIMWSRSASPTGRRSPVPQGPAPTLARPLYDTVMLVATVLGPVLAVVTLIIQQ